MYSLPVTRRRLLAIFVAAAGALLSVLLLWRPARLARLTSRLFKPRLDTAAPTGSLSDSEMDTILAFAAVLVEGRELSAEERGYLVEHVSERAAQTPGYLALYRRTAAVLDALAAGPFRSRPLLERTSLVTRHGLTRYDVRIREYLTPVRREILAVRALAVPDLIGGYYSSPAGWATVGYGAFPGRCGELSRYTKAEA
jgi:hypothetical protein